MLSKTARTKTTMKSFPALACLSALLLTGCSPTSTSVGSAQPPAGETPIDDPARATAKDIACELVSVAPTSDWYATARFRATNRGSAAFAYHGFAPESPIYSVEVLVDGTWQEHPLGWCGTGLEEQVLEPGKSVEFDVNLERDGRSYRFSFGTLAVVTPAASSPAP
jgi:hypothetical protein